MQLKQIGMVVITLITLGALAGCGTVNGTTSATNGTSTANNTGNAAYSNTHSNVTGTTATNVATNTAGKNNPTPVNNLVAIQGTVRNVNSQGSDTNVTILISKVKYTGTISPTYLNEFGNNESVTITFSGTPSSYGLKVSPGQRMMMYLTPAIMKTKKAHWDGYEYDKNGQYVNWKGQDIAFS